ncbi:MAG TPA: MBL fold metallo-hydrolase [Thermoplasmata archaeon]
MARLADDRHIPLAELPHRLAELPRDRPIVVYDQHGGGARRAAALLARSGYAPVAFLEGGIDAYAREVDPSVGRYRADGRAFVLRQLPRPSTGCLAYLLGDPGERMAVLVDPGHDVAPYLHTLHEEHWRLTAIVETHTHADHLAGHAALARSTGAPVIVSHRSPAQYPHVALTEGEAVAVGSFELVALETPGHTRDHLTLTFEGSIFCGDTLLIGGCGRTDLGDGDPDLLYDSLTQKILSMDDGTFVYPAHYGPRHALADQYVSTVGVERATNEALRQPDRAAFRRYMTEGWPPKPVNFDQLVAANLAPFPE